MELDRGGTWITQDLCPNGLVVHVGNETSSVDAGDDTPAEKAGGLAADRRAAGRVSTARRTRPAGIPSTRRARALSRTLANRVDHPGRASTGATLNCRWLETPGGYGVSVPRWAVQVSLVPSCGADPVRKD